MPNPKKRGVSLASFAAVRAGLAEGLPLPGLLEAEKIQAASWRRAEGAFDEALADSAAGDGVLLRAFDAHLIVAQDRLARPLPPLDAELGAWLGFVRRISQSEEPTRLLAELGLRSTDVLRLHRAWMTKLGADRELADQARQILGEEPEELPALSPYPSDGVRPIPPRAEAAEAAEEPPAAAGREEDEDADAADEETDADEEKAAAGPPLFAPLAFEGVVPDPPKRPKPPRPAPPPKDKTRPPSVESAVPVATPAPGRPFEPEASLPAPPAEAPAAPARPAALPSFMRQTASASPPVAPPASPPVAPPASPPVAPPASSPVAPPASPPAPASQPQRLDSTSEFILPNLAAILPFASKKPEKEGERAKPVEVRDVSASAPPAPAAPPATTAGLPSDLVQRIAAGKLPFAHSASPPAAPAAPRPQDEPSTMDARPSPLAGAVLPFAKDRREAPGTGAPGAPASAKSPLPVQAPPKAPPAARPPSDHGAEHATLEAAPSPIKAALPFQQKPPSARTAAPASPPAAPPPAARASVPFAPQPPAQPPAASNASPSAALTLDQYASMCAELAVFADRVDAVFAKYGLTDVRRRTAVDAAWKERLSRYPSERAEWERRYWQYESSWRRSRR